MTIILRPYQETLIDGARIEMAAKKKRILLQAPCGAGKCLGAGTPILMFDGSIKAVEDVVVGDLLMGPDSKPRKVVSLARGREMMYRVTPKRAGDSYVVNESHILSLKLGKAHWRFNLPDGSTAVAGDVVNIEVRDFLAAGKTFQSYAKGWKVPVTFKRRAAPKIPPYVMGAWLGDGLSRHSSLTTADTKIADEFIKFGRKIGLKPRVEQNSDWSVNVHMTTQTKGAPENKFLNWLRDYGVYRNKHIPDDYRLGSEFVRLETLAGIIDTDGYYGNVGYEVTQKSKRLADDVAFVARSLGFAVSVSEVTKKCHNNGVVGKYFSVSITGHVERIPCRLDRKKASPRLINKDHLSSAITVEPIGEGDYFGFELSGPDRLFLLGDFTVTHNTVLASFMTRNTIARGHGVMFLTHREELALQASRTYSRIGVQHGLIMAGITPDYRLPAQVAMIDTLRNRLDKTQVPKVIIVDEAHHAVSPSWKKVIDYYAERGAVVIGLSATPQRLDGRGLGDVFESLVLGPSVRELIDAGALCDYDYFAPPSFIDTAKIKMQYGDFDKKALEQETDKPQIIGDAIGHYQRLLSGKRAIAFAVSIAHSQHVAAQFNAAGIPAAHVDGETPTGERKRIIRDFAEGRIMVMSNVSLFGEGFDVPACEGAIFLRATASLALHIQMCGRPMRPHDSKDRCVIIDHVGNVTRHGLPDEEREWTLAGREKKRGKKKAEDDITIKQCPVCYAAHLPAPVCPKCGHVYEVKGRELEQVDGELQEITPEMREAMHRAKMKEQGRAQTVEQLVAIGKSRWEAERIVKYRAEKQEIISGLTADLTAWQETTGEMPFPVFGVSYRDIRYMKPKELKDLRARFEAHKAEYLAARSGEFELELT